MKRNIIKLNENVLRHIIRESLKNIIREQEEEVQKILTEGQKWIGDYGRDNFEMLRQKVSECGGTCSFSLNGQDFTIMRTQRGFTITSGADFRYDSFEIDSALKAAWQFSNGAK